MHTLEEIQQLVSDRLERYVKKNGRKSIYEPIGYILSLGGKRLRPALSIMAAELFTDEIDAAISPAAAVEVFHNFTLMHDDIMDEAPIRRGKPTVHIKWNPNVAILSGDAMMIQSYQLLSDTKPELFLNVLEVFNKTALEVCEGQQQDMDFEKRSDVSIEEYLEMIRLKTSVLLAGAMQMGAIVGGADKSSQKHVYQFGENLGIAFQLLDDYLDVFGDETKVGKQKAGDIISDKKTYLLIKALEKSEGEDKVVLNYWIGKKPKDPTEKVRAITAIFKKLQVDEDLLLQVNRYHDAALYELKKLPVFEERKAPLLELAEKMLVRQH